MNSEDPGGAPPETPPASPSPARTANRPPVAVASAAGALILAAGVTLFLHLQRRSEHATPGSGAEGPAVLELNLGTGSTRGADTVPMLSLSSGLRAVTLVFQVPANPAALYEVEVRNPAGEPMLRQERGPLVMDDLGTATLTIRVSRFEKRGEHQLVLREFSGDGRVREYRYPFRVTLPPSQ